MLPFVLWRWWFTYSECWSNKVLMCLESIFCTPYALVTLSIWYWLFNNNGSFLSPCLKGMFWFCAPYWSSCGLWHHSHWKPNSVTYNFSKSKSGWLFSVQVFWCLKLDSLAFLFISSYLYFLNLTLYLSVAKFYVSLLFNQLM